MLAIALLVAGALALTVGAALIFVPAGWIIAGLCLGLAGWDLSRPTPAAGSGQ